MDRLLKQLSQTSENNLLSQSSEETNDINDFSEQKTSKIPETLWIGTLNQELVALIPFGDCNGIVLRYPEEKIRESYLLIQDLILQVIYKMPSNYSMARVLESENLGRNLSLIQEIENTKIETQFLLNTQANITDFLQDLENLIKERNQLLGYKHDTIADYNTDTLENHPYHLCLLSEFAQNWSEENLIFFERLLPKCQAVGIYFFIISSQNIDENLLKNFVIISQDVDKFKVQNIEKEEVINQRFELKLLHIDLKSNFERIDKILANLKS